MNVTKTVATIVRTAITDTVTTLRLVTLLTTATSQLTLVVLLWILLRR